MTGARVCILPLCYFLDLLATYVSESPSNHRSLVRTYSSSTCSPSTLSGLLLSAGTCFYVSESEPIGSYRADCVGIDYTDSNGDDHGNSYSVDAGDADVVDILATATGPVTVSPTNGQVTKTVIPVKVTSSSASSSATNERGADSTASATSSVATTSMSSLANAGTKKRGVEMTTPLGLVLVLAAFLGQNAFI